MGLITKQQGECVWAVREWSDFLLRQVSGGFLEFYPDLFKSVPATRTPDNITDDLKVVDNSKGNSPAWDPKKSNIVDIIYCILFDCVP